MSILAALDLGITNTDTILEHSGVRTHERMDTHAMAVTDQVRVILNGFIQRPSIAAVTGGQYRMLPENLNGTRLVKIGEVEAIGRGGLALAGLDSALVVSAGSGTAMVSAKFNTSFEHATGSAVGGGTMQGLGRLLLGTADPFRINRLAMKGDANNVDLTLGETIGARVGMLPLEANAVNFGKLARRRLEVSQEDTAAALVRLIAQVIAVVAINAAKAADLQHIVVIGHLVDLESIREVLSEVSRYYQASILVPENPGSGTALGAFLALKAAQAL